MALLDRSEQHHASCAMILQPLNRPLVTCEAVIAEACYLLRALPGAAEAILSNVTAGVFQIPFQLARSSAQIVRTLRKYRDREVDLADACLIHLAGELQTGDILTLDSDFRIYRWGSNKAFRILIDA